MFGQKGKFSEILHFFEKGCNETARTNLKSTIGITCRALSEKYLSLPTIVG
jgi:hypothetical protein